MTKVLRQQIQLKPAFKVSHIRILTQSSFEAFLLINMNMYMTISVWLGVLFHSKLALLLYLKWSLKYSPLSVSMGSRGGSKWMRKEWIKSRVDVYCWHGTAMARTPMPETHENGKAFPWSEWECCKCAQKIPKPSFLIWGVFLGLLSTGDRLPRPAKLFLTADSPPFLVVAAVDTLHLSKPSLPSSGFSAYAPLFCPFFIPSLPQTAFTNED